MYIYVYFYKIYQYKFKPQSSVFISHLASLATVQDIHTSIAGKTVFLRGTVEDHDVRYPYRHKMHASGAVRQLGGSESTHKPGNERPTALRRRSENHEA